MKSQEIVAPAFALGTWPDLLRRCALVSFFHTQGALHGLTNGSCNVSENNALAGKFWMDLALRDIACHALRVTSKPNVADGPPRYELGWVRELHAEFVSPYFPDWAWEVWKLWPDD